MTGRITAMALALAAAMAGVPERDAAAQAIRHVFRSSDRPSSVGVSIAAGRVEAVTEDGASATVRLADGTLVANQFVVFHADGAPLAAGHVTSVSSGAAEVKFDWIGVLPALGFEAAVLPIRCGLQLKELLPSDCSMRARVGEVDSAGGECRLELAAEGGFEAGDRLIVVRKGLPIARLTVRRVDDGHATAAIERLVANAAPIEGDEAKLEQNPAERRAGRLRSRLLRVEGKGDQTVWFPAAAADGAAIDDRWTVRDGGSYIGMVEVQELRGPFAVGQAFAAMCRRPLRVGDELVRRDPRDVRAGRTPLHVFRVEGNYVLVNAGESDQLVRDQRLFVVREGRVRATLVVTTVKMDFCGTRIEPVTSNEAAGGGVVADDDVYVTLPKAPVRRAVATIEWVEADGRVAAAKLQEGATMRRGEVVSVGSDGGAFSAGIVVAAGREGATIYLPAISRAGATEAGAEVYTESGP